ncbi:MAG: hypothetical protein U1F55_13125 [Chitinivorax sp.]
MITLQAIRATASPVTQSASSPQQANAAPAAPSPVEDKVSLSSTITNKESQWIDIPGQGRFDLSKIPLQPAPASYWGEHDVKEAMRRDWLSNGVYVDDNYLDAMWQASNDVNLGPGPIPDIPLPTPPDWWSGYRP